MPRPDSLSGDPAEARSVEDLVRADREGARRSFLFFWSHRPQHPDRVDSACLSQWWPAAFVADGHRFPTAEHYLMWRKALLFNDDATAANVLAADGPGAAKALGRAVRGFNDDTWATHRWEIAVSGSLAKFDSDDALRSFLFGTIGRVLVEASPADRIWGIGLPAKAPAAHRPESWQGLNLLGFALMEARARLLSQWVA